jgi:hypothetical protein
MQELMAETKIQDFTKFRKQVSLLKQSFEERFADFQEDAKYCDERGIYKFYFITIAENIHLQLNKFRFVLPTSQLFLYNL